MYDVVALSGGDAFRLAAYSLTNHTATSDDDGKTFDTDEIKPDETSRPVKFEKAGEFNFHCKIHGKIHEGDGRREANIKKLIIPRYNYETCAGTK